MIDHRSTCDPTGTKDGKLEEWDTKSCPHCQAVMRVQIVGPTRKKIDSPGECTYCNKPICRACARQLIVSDVCPGEMRENVERMWQQMRARDSIWIAMKR